MNPKPTFFLRDGTATDEKTWLERQADGHYQRVEEGVVGEGQRWVSTVWTGVDRDQHQPPLIFETKVFETESRVVLDEARYATEKEARSGHQRLVSRWNSTAV